MLFRAFCLSQVEDYYLLFARSHEASGRLEATKRQWRNGSSERVAAEDDALRV